VVAGYTAVAVVATWPLARYPLGGFYGFGNDNWGGIPYLGWVHDAYLGPASASFSPEFQAPFGFDIPNHALQPMNRLAALLFGGFDQGLGANNAQIFSSFVLAGCTMYLFARYLTESPFAAAIAGFAFTFSPFHLSIAMQYDALASIQWIPLYLLALLVLLQRRETRHAVWTGAAFALVAATSYYYAWFLGWFTLIVVAAFAVWLAVDTRRREGRVRRTHARRFLRLGLARGAVAGGVALVLLVPLLLPSARSAAEAGSEAIEHPIVEGIRYSARPWMFFVPPHDNPLVGDRVQPWVLNHLYDSPVYEQSLYLGYTLLALAVFGLWRRHGVAAGRREVFARGFLVTGAFAGGLIMMGPYLPLDTAYWRLWSQPDATRHLPSLGWLMFELAPVFRFFARAQVLVTACLAALAAIGFARLEPRLGRSLVWRFAATALVLGLVWLEFTNAPPRIWYSDSAPPWVAAVEELPRDSTIAQYPAAPAFSPRSMYYMFWQSKHRRRITQPAVDPPAQALAATIASPDDPNTGKALHEAGIDYAVMHTRLPPSTTFPYQPALPPDAIPADAGSLNPWLAPARRTSDAVIYRVLDRPRTVTGAAARPAAGFGFEETEGTTTARWLEEPTGQLALTVTGKRRPLVLGVDLASFAQPRRVAFRLDGRPVGSPQWVDADAYRAVTVPLGDVAPGAHTIELIPTPAPQSIAETTGQPDPRTVSVRLRGAPAITPGRG
jgi:hypothetical protein